MVKCIVVTGPTATGKTALGVRLCQAVDGEIISADSRQVYQGLDLGSGKDYDLYETDSGRIPAHIIDVVSPHEAYHLHRYLQDVNEALTRIRKRDHVPVFTGGTPLYIDAVLNAYELAGGPPDPVLRQSLEQLSGEELRKILWSEAPDVYERTDTTQHKRLVRAIEIARFPAERRHTPDTQLPALEPLILAPYFPRAEIHKRIEERLDQRIRQGLVEEVRLLNVRDGVSWERLEFFGLEYRYTARYLQGHLSFDAFRSQLAARIRHLCKSQDIWFRKMEREGKIIHWLPQGDFSQALDLTRRFLNNDPLPAPSFQLKDIRYDSKGRVC